MALLAGTLTGSTRQATHGSTRVLLAAPAPVVVEPTIVLRPAAAPAAEPEAAGGPAAAARPTATTLEHAARPRASRSAAAPRPRPAAPTTTVAPPPGGYRSPIPRNAIEACIVRREHGGSYSEGTNPTHKGRYQFARGTWIANGGPAGHWDDWALTTPQEQDAVFVRAVSRNGYGDWTPYNGC